MCGNFFIFFVDAEVSKKIQERERDSPSGSTSVNGFEDTPMGGHLEDLLKWTNGQDEKHRRKRGALVQATGKLER